MRQRHDISGTLCQLPSVPPSPPSPPAGERRALAADYTARTRERRQRLALSAAWRRERWAGHRGITAIGTSRDFCVRRIESEFESVQVRALVQVSRAPALHSKADDGLIRLRHPVGQVDT